MYPIEHIYSYESFKAWRANELERLRPFRQGAEQVLDGDFWDVASWNELRTAVSYLTLANKRHVLYFRGQRSDFRKCLPILFRDEWTIGNRTFALHAHNRGAYFAAIRELQADVFAVVKEVGTPRRYILEHLPAATAAVLQHYELWPTHFVDITRSLPTALSFAIGDKARSVCYLYVFAMPDLRGSITSDIDQHISLARLEAICPPDAIRPHHQDAYLVARFPEPQGLCRPGEKYWDDWQGGSDLMRRLVAKFRITLTNGILPAAPTVSRKHLIPDFGEDRFGNLLTEALLPRVGDIAARLDA